MRNMFSTSKISLRWIPNYPFSFYQRVAGILATHVAHRPYPHIRSVCAYLSVTNADGPFLLGSVTLPIPRYAAWLACNQLDHPPERLAPVRQSGWFDSPRIAPDVCSGGCLLDHTLHQDSLRPLFVFPTCNGQQSCVHAVLIKFPAFPAEA